MKKKDRPPIEDEVQEQFIIYLQAKYPAVIFQVNWLSGSKLPIGLAVKAKRKGHQKSIPDIMIFEPRGNYHGLFIELKRDSKRIKGGTYTGSDVHLSEQEDILSRLRSKGYFAIFCGGYESAIETLDKYMSL